MARGPPDAPGRAAERAGQKPRRVGRPEPSGEHSPLSVAPPVALLVTPDHTRSNPRFNFLGRGDA